MAVAVACWRCARESWAALSHVKVISSLLDPSLGEEDGSAGGGDGKRGGVDGMELQKGWRSFLTGGEAASSPLG